MSQKFRISYSYLINYDCSSSLDKNAQSSVQRECSSKLCIGILYVFIPSNCECSWWTNAKARARPTLNWPVSVYFISTSHYFRKLLSPPCHPFLSKMFREDTAETSHWRAGLRETMSHTMQVIYVTNANLVPNLVCEKFSQPSGTLCLYIFAALEICIFILRFGDELSGSDVNIHQVISLKMPWERFINFLRPWTLYFHITPVLVRLGFSILV